MLNLTEAMDRFKSDHPEMAQTEHDLEIARAAILSYQRARQTFEPLTLNFDKLNSVQSWKVCTRCGGRGWINVTTYSGTANTSGTVNMHTEGCPSCGGKGGHFK